MLGSLGEESATKCFSSHRPEIEYEKERSAKMG